MAFFGSIVSRSARRLRLSVDRLEPRALLASAGFTPTANEQYYLEQLNDARFNPGAYGASLGLNLSNIAPSQPLAFNTQLIQSARLHSLDMIARNYFGHYTPEGLDPGKRISSAGFAWTSFGESIESNTQISASSQPFADSFGQSDTSVSLSNLIIDQGIADLGHRVMLLDIGGKLHSERQVGIGIATQDQPDATAGFTDRVTDTTLDTASGKNTNPFLTGVVFNDMNGDGLFEPGEGVGGVTISVANAGVTSTFATGGYGIQLAPGTYTVTVSGGGLPAPMIRTVVIGNDNQRLNLDLDPNGTTLAAASGANAGGVLGWFAAFQSGDTAANYSARIDWGNGKATMATLTSDGQGGFFVSGSSSYASGGAYAVRVLVTRLSDGHTRAINATLSVDGVTGGWQAQPFSQPSPPATTHAVKKTPHKHPHARPHPHAKLHPHARPSHHHPKGVRHR